MVNVYIVYYSLIMDKYSELVKRLLEERGISSAESAENFLNPDYTTHTHDPFLLRGMDTAVERVLQAIKEGEKIAIYSDFDADGIPGGVILHDFFKRIGFENFTNYIPHRDTEGYGVHSDAIDKLAKGGVSLIITVDVGIGALDAVGHARGLDVDVIITDHHEPGDDIDELNEVAVSVIDAKQTQCNYPFTELCGSGIAFKLVSALLSTMRDRVDCTLDVKSAPEGWEKWLLDLVAIATIADMVPLTGENRVLAKWGLHVLRKSRRPGVRALCKRIGTKQHLLTEDDIGFMIAPRINAASRMDTPEDAFAMLATNDDEEAQNIVAHLEKLNNKRKGIVSAMVRELKNKFSAIDSAELPDILVAGNPEWSPALLGLAAGSIAGEFDRPVCLWGREGTGLLKGSCRGNGTVSIVELLKSAGDALLGFGGHNEAGGFSVSSEKVHTLPKSLQEALAGIATEDKKETDAKPIKLEIKNANTKTLNEIKLLAPFGVGNPKPVFEFDGVTIESFKEFGKDKNHIEIMVSDGDGGKIRAFTFFAGVNSFTKQVKEGTKINLHANLGETSWGVKKPELRIIDLT